MSARALSLLLGSAALVFISVLLEWPSWLRLPLVCAWLFVVPGWMWARRLRLGDAVDRFVVGIALSVTLLMAVGAAMALTGFWRPIEALVVLTAIGVIGGIWPGKDEEKMGQER